MYRPQKIQDHPQKKLKTRLPPRLALALAPTLATLALAASANSATADTISWQGGSGNFSGANWTVDAVENQNHPSFGAANNNSVVHNTTINLGTVNGFNNALVRDRASIDPGVSVEILVGTDLTTWPLAYTVGADTASSTEGVTDNGNGIDTITLTAHQTPHSGRFARLMVIIAE